MWTLTGAAWCAAGLAGYLLLGSLLDLTATGIAFLLLLLPNPVDKVHGFAKVSLQLIFLVCAVTAVARHGEFVATFYTDLSRLLR